MRLYSKTLDNEADQKLVLSNSLERVINNAIKVAENADMVIDNDDNGESTASNEDASILLDDLQAMKPVLVALWREVQESVRINLRTARNPDDQWAAAMKAAKDKEHK